MTHFGTSAKFLDAAAKFGLKPRETHRLDTVRAMFSTGSPLVAEGFEYVYRDIKADLQLSSISGGTDIISCFVLGSPVLPVWRGEIQCRGLGMAVDVWDDEGRPLRGEKGELVCARPFPVIKFRTMRVDAEAQTGPVWARAGDPRCTRLGALLRKYSLDELPQFINVVLGDMSLVGPRPERPVFVEEFRQPPQGEWIVMEDPEGNEFCVV